MSSYNLIDEGWIPLRLRNGRREYRGLERTLLDAKEIEAIEDSSPLITAALYRLLLAILYRALEGPSDFYQAKSYFTSGFPAEKIRSYLKRWRDRFWLFDENYPFGQHPHLAQENAGTWNRLAADRNPTKNKMLFDHTEALNPEPITATECARWIVATMQFSISGGRGFFPSPAANTMLCIPSGQNLEETLCHCLVPYENKAIQAADSALWEREALALPLSIQKRVSRGYADLYSWQPRLVELLSLSDGRVAKVIFAPSEGIDSEARGIDPMIPYKKDEEKGLLPVRFRANRGTWRDFDSLLPDDSGLAPLTVQHAVRLANRNPSKLPRAMLVLGLNYQPPNANIEFWRMESFRFPEAVVGQHGIAFRSTVRQVLEAASHTESGLWKACRSFARDLLGRGDRDPAKADISRFMERMTVIPHYWSILEARFHDLLGRCSADGDSQEVMLFWHRALQLALRDAWSAHRADAMRGDAWSIRALAKAEILIRAAERYIDDRILELASEKEVV